MAYKRKTVDCYAIEGNCGYGWAGLDHIHTTHIDNLITELRRRENESKCIGTL